MTLPLDSYEITTDTTRMDVPAIHAFLSQTYWSPGIPLGVVERAIANSLCFGVFSGYFRPLAAPDRMMEVHRPNAYSA